MELRARRLRTPSPRPGAYCPNPDSRDVAVLPGIPAEAARGIGPVYFAFPVIPRFLDFLPPKNGAPAARTGWRRAEVIWVSEPAYRGPVLVRGRRVGGGSKVGFGNLARPEFELRLPAGGWAEGRGAVHVWGETIHAEKRWRVASAPVRVRGDGCYFLQIDGNSFSERGILFGVNWQAPAP